MKTQALLIFPVLCFVTVTLGAPTLSESQFKGDDLTKSFDDLNAPFIDAEECFKDAEEYFQPQGSITSTSSNQVLGRKCERLEKDSYFVEFRDLKTSETHSFISIPDLEGKDHVYVVQLNPELGFGMIGVVYLAKDIKIPNKFVAIKKFTGFNNLAFEGLKLAGELLGSGSAVNRANYPKQFLVMPFVPGITLKDLAKKEYNGHPVYEYWTKENNKGYYTLLDRIARDVVAPLMNKFLIHKDLRNMSNMMVAQIDENYLPRETDPATGLQHFRAIDFDRHHKILEGEDILGDIDALAGIIYDLPYSPIKSSRQTKEIFQKAVIAALDKTKFDIKLDADGMPKEVRRRRNYRSLSASVVDGVWRCILRISEYLIPKYT